MMPCFFGFFGSLVMSFVPSAVALTTTAVAVVTYDRPAYLTRCLRQIREQDVDLSTVAVIVVDDTQPSCRGAVEGRLGCPLEAFLAPAALRYVETERRSIGSKRTTALNLAKDCDVLVNWDDDDVYGVDRLRRQVEATKDVDATVLTPAEWRFEPTGDVMTLPWLPRAVASLDPHLLFGSELLDEAIASLALNLKNTRHLSYPDQSYDEDRVFLRHLKNLGLKCKRLPPGEPTYVHVKHLSAVANGPLTKLYAANLGLLASPVVFLPLFGALAAALGRLLRLASSSSSFTPS